MQIIPAINAPNFQTVKDLIFKAREFLPPTGWIHIDVVDGIFSPASVWGNPAELKKLIVENTWLRKMNIEIHLMVMHPENVIAQWLAAGANRIIVHKEAVVDPDAVAQQCKDFGAQAMLAIKPETPVEELKPFLKRFTQFQVLAVTPGWAGQKFQAAVINKIQYIREQAPDAIIEVDGGINVETARMCKAAGADLAVAASYIFGGDNPNHAYEELQAAVM